MHCGAHLSRCRLRVYDPDFGLERTLGNGYEADQKHILHVHEPFADFPPPVSRSVHRTSLGSSCEPQRARILIVMQTYSHGYKVLVEFVSDLVRKLATSYPDAVLRPAQGSNLPPQSACGNVDGSTIFT